MESKKEDLYINEKYLFIIKDGNIQTSIKTYEYKEDNDNYFLKVKKGVKIIAKKAVVSIEKIIY